MPCMERTFIFVQPACSEQDIVIIMTIWCMCMPGCASESKFVPTQASTIVDGFQNNLTQFLLHHL